MIMKPIRTVVKAASDVVVEGSDFHLTRKQQEKLAYAFFDAANKGFEFIGQKAVQIFIDEFGNDFNVSDGDDSFHVRIFNNKIDVQVNGCNGQEVDEVFDIDEHDIKEIEKFDLSAKNHKEVPICVFEPLSALLGGWVKAIISDLGSENLYS